MRWHHDGTAHHSMEAMPYTRARGANTASSHLQLKFSGTVNGPHIAGVATRGNWLQPGA